MGYGFGGFLLVIGLVLALAVTDSINEVDLTAVGWIMAAVGVVLIALTAFTMNSRRETRSVSNTVDHEGRQTTSERRTEM